MAPQDFKYGAPIRELDRVNVHWRNTPLLTQFMNSCSLIKPRVLTRLSIIDQKLIARTIKTARKMRLLPVKGSLMPHHSIPLTSLDEDIRANMVRKVDMDSGAIYMHEPETNWEKETKQNLEKNEKILSQHDFG